MGEVLDGSARPPQSSRIAWVSSEFCTNSSCVEVALVEDAVLVRDAKDADHAPLRFDVPEWEAFVAGVKAGQFDVPALRENGNP